MLFSYTSMTSNAEQCKEKNITHSMQPYVVVHSQAAGGPVDLYLKIMMSEAVYEDRKGLSL